MHKGRVIFERVRYSVVMILFFLILSLTFTAIALEDFTRRDNLKDFIIENTESKVSEEEISTAYNIYYEQCSEGAIDVEIPFEDGTRILSCEDVLSSTKDDFYGVVIEKTYFNDIYNRNYPCTFVQCLMNEDTRTVIISSQGNVFLNNIKIFLIIGSIIITLLVAVLSKSVKGAFRSVGSGFAFVSVGYVVAKYYPIQYTDTLFEPVFIPALTLMIIGIVMFITSFFVKNG